MNCPTRSIRLVLAAGLALSLAQAAPGSAQTATNNAAVDCSKADSTMMEPDTSMQSMKPTGDIDKDFAQMMMAHNKKMMAMARTEVACGKDPKAKAMAQKALDQANANARSLRLLLGGGA